ncbi:protein serine/threonine phosphatase 2C [Whalleya microplaca]|nr:protein serine/threonine phosphatase 2C [Whalleya microplaca]
MALARGPPKRWSLKDTYGFIATFVEAQARMRTRTRTPAPAPARTRTYAHRATAERVTGPPFRDIQRQSRSLSTAPDADATQSPAEPQNVPPPSPSHSPRRGFHTYFVTHLPSSSLHPDSRMQTGPHHKLPRSAAAPHTAGSGTQPVSPPHLPPNRDLTVVRIPLRSAKHHFGAADSRGSRPYNEDTNQAGTIDIPAFARRAPISLVRSAMTKSGEGTPADSAFGDPQVFYFGVFDGHGGTQCSDFLRDELHGYIEEAAVEFELKSSLRALRRNRNPDSQSGGRPVQILSDAEAGGQKKLDSLDIKSSEQVAATAEIPEADTHGAIQEIEKSDAIAGDKPVPAKVSQSKALQLQRKLVKEYKTTIGGYFRRFHPPYFHLKQDPESAKPPVSIESVLMYAFLRADLDFVRSQAVKPDPDDPYVSDTALNRDEVLGSPHHPPPPSGHGVIGGPTRFKGGSTASVALISTPTPAPFWHPAATSTLLVAHVGDTRVLLCETTTGLARPLTSDHHPGSPAESHRLRRFTTSFVADSFGEERIQGLANSRAFGDMGSKRLGVSAEPELTRTELGPAQYSFLALMSDGVSGSLSDQEIVDVVKEAKTPEQGARDVVAYATEVSADGDNATCLVVRLGGWERRSEGGLGSLGTKEIRDYRRNEALDPRRGRR